MAVLRRTILAAGFGWWHSPGEPRFTVGSCSAEKDETIGPIANAGLRGTNIKNDPVKFHRSCASEHTLRVGHLLRLDQLIEFVACQMAQLHGCFPQTRMLYVGCVRDLGGFVIADLRR